MPRQALDLDQARDVSGLVLRQGMPLLARRRHLPTRKPAPPSTGSDLHRHLAVRAVVDYALGIVASRFVAREIGTFTLKTKGCLLLQQV